MNGGWHVVRRVPEMPAELHALCIIFLAGIYNRDVVSEPRSWIHARTAQGI